MYIFTFSRYYWFDKIVYLNNWKNISAGDLIEFWWEYALVLWKDIPFKEIYNKYLVNLDYKIYKKKFLTKNSICLINYIVQKYFSSFKRVVPLYIPNMDIEKLFSYRKKVKKTVSYKFYSENWCLYSDKENIDYQQLIVFPDIWSVYNSFLDFTFLEDNKVYNSSSTIAAKSKLFWWISDLNYKNLVCTQSQIFKNWKKLKEIIVFSPHTWYYKNHQEPRYNAIDILEKMSNLEWANLKFIQDYRLFSYN